MGLNKFEPGDSTLTAANLRYEPIGWPLACRQNHPEEQQRQIIKQTGYEAV